MKKRLLLLGDDAIALGALQAGISGAYAYPGTPSTEIMEFIQKSPDAAQRGIHRVWSVNEKTAMEEALGMSYAGKRALVCMKHVGLNVAADPFVNSAITGVNGGVVVVVADDPSMHSSQNEQDSRFFARFAGIPSFEPANQQEAYEIMADAFDLSEAVKLPVLVRITTRLAHSRADVLVSDMMREENTVSYPDDPRQFTLLPVNARRNYDCLIEKRSELEVRASSSGYNRFLPGADRSLGIIASGIAFNYLMECFESTECVYPVLKISQYPVPDGLVLQLAEQCETILVVEEGDAFIEEMLKSVFLPENIRIKGRLDGTIKRTGEINVDVLAGVLDQPRKKGSAVPDFLAARPPALCKGCPHCDTYHFLNEAMKEYPGGRVFSDIGCYTLGALPPYNAIDTCVDMGASVTMAKGASDAGLFPSVAVIGDSTFTHSGLTGIVDAVTENSNITVLILDNDLVAMTGGQMSLGSGKLDKMVLGLGVEPEHVRIVVPLKNNHDENLAVLKEEIGYNGVSVIISQRQCIHKKQVTI